MDITHRQHHPALGWIMWSMAGLFFFAHYFVRVAPQVMYPELMRDFSVTASALGSLAFWFYLSYVSAQMPLGILVDKIGTRLVLSACVMLAAIATLLFSHAQVIESAYLARFIFGIAAAVGFVSAIKLGTAWFAPSRLSLAIGLTQTLGMCGGLLGTAYMPQLLNQFGWRQTFDYFAYGFIILSLVIFCLLRNRPKSDIEEVSKEAIEENKEATWGALKSVIKSRATWMNALFCGLVFAPMALYGESWGAAFLTGVHDIPVTQSGPAISAVFVGWCLGAPIAGTLSNVIGRKPVMRIAAIGGLIFIPIIMFIHPLPLIAICAVNFLFGLSNAGLVASYTIAGEMHSKQTAGLSMAIANMFTIIIGLGLQPLVGLVLDLRFAGHAEFIDGIPVYLAGDYQAALIMMPVSLLLAFLCTFGIPETLKRTG